MHLSNPYKQGLPERQGRNRISPLKGIDTFNDTIIPPFS